MPYDIRRIAFDDTRVLAAVYDFAALHKSALRDVTTISGLKIEPGRDGANGRVLIGPKFAPSSWLLSQDDLVRAFVRFCLKEEIALPSRGVKTIEAVAGRPALFVRRLYAGDPGVQDLIIDNGDGSTADNAIDIWQSEAVASLPDVRLVMFSLPEVIEAVAAHLMQVTKNNRLELPGAVELVEGSNGVSAHITSPLAAGANATLLTPEGFLHAMIAYCRSKKIGLPARSPKWLERISSQLVSLVVSKPAGTIAFVEVDQPSGLHRPRAS